MINYPKSNLKFPYIGWVVDTGTYLGIGNSVVNKNLTIAGIDRKFMPYTGTGTTAGNSYSTAPVIYDTASTGSNLMLTGNNCLLRMQYFPNTNNNSASWLQPYAKPGGWQTFCYGSTAPNVTTNGYFSPYFTSTLGATSGNKYVIIGNEFSQVNIDGTLLKLNTAIGLTAVSGAQANYHLSIIAENATTFFGLENINGAYTGSTTTSQANFRFFSINKTTWALTGLGVLTNSKQYWYSAPKLLGTTNDGLLVIACYPVPSTGAASGVYGTLYYYILNPTTGAVTQSTVGQLINSINTVATCSVPSSVSADAQSSTNWKYYIPSCNASGNTATSITRLYLPKTLGSISDPTTGTPTTCTLVSMPAGITIPNPNINPTNPLYTATGACLYLNQLVANTKEYVVVLTMGYANMSGTGGYVSIAPSTMLNGCPVSNHSLFVFQIDPTNSANLIYKSYIQSSAFGVNAPLFNINTSTDNTYIVLSNETQFVILTWNVSTESYSYSQTYTINEGIGRISMDTQNQLWIHSNTTQNMWVYSLTNSINTVITFSNNVTSVDYSGSNVSQNVTVNCYNLIGTRQAHSVTLNVTGPAVFTSTGTTTVNLTTLTTGDSIVNLTINGSGLVNVTPTSIV